MVSSSCLFYKAINTCADVAAKYRALYGSQQPESDTAIKLYAAGGSRQLTPYSLLEQLMCSINA
eukprot:17184-Heterococcus_DN1.PRE.3